MLTVSVADYGLDPLDATPALRAALEFACSQTQPSRVVLPTGTYHVYPDHAARRELYVSNTVGTNPTFKEKSIALLFEDASDVTFDGQGSMLIMHGQQTILSVIRSQRCTVENLKIDWVAPRTIDLTVVNSGADFHDLRVPDHYRWDIDGKEISWWSDDSPYTGGPYWHYEKARSPESPRDADTDDFYVQVTDLRSGRARRFTWATTIDPMFHDVARIVEVGPRTLRCELGPDGVPAPVGSVFQLRSQHRDTPGCFIWESEDTTLRDLEIGYLHGFGIIAQFTDGVTLQRLRFRTFPGTWRTTVGFADLVQISGDKGKVLIEDCEFGFSQDDPINVHGTYLALDSVDGRSATFSFRHPETAGFPALYVGDEVVLVEMATMRDVPGWVGTVVDVAGPTGKDRSMPLESIQVTFDRELPEGAVPGSVVAENLTYTPSVEVRRNRFESIASRAILMTTRKPVVIEDNVFDQVEMATIFVSADAKDWYESGVVQDLVIRDNLFVRPSHDNTWWAPPVIWFEPMIEMADPGAVAHSGVRIENNTFLTGNRILVDAKSVGGLSFTGNTIARYKEPSYPDYHNDKPSLVLRGCTGVEVSGNELAADMGELIATEYMRESDLIAEHPWSWLGEDDSEPDVAQVEFDGLEVASEPQNFVHDAVLVPAGVETFRFRPTAARPDVSLEVRYLGQVLEPGADGWFTLPVHPGPAVLECWTSSSERVTREIHRWAFIAP